MSDLDSLIAAFNGNSNNSAPAKTERKASQLWLNVGVPVPGPDGTVTFVSLPFGLALDDMEAKEIRGSNPDSIARQQAQKQLLAAVKASVGKQEPGVRQIIPQLRIEGYRVATPDANAGVDSSLVAGVLAHFGG